MSKEKNKINPYIVFIILLISVIILSYFFGYYNGRKNVALIDKYVFVNDVINDTIIVKTKPKLVRDSIIVKDTINNITYIDTIYIAKIDTTFPDSLYLSIDYYSPPINYFDIRYRLPKPKIITNIVDSKDNRFSISIGTGALFGSKGLDYGFYIGVSYNLIKF